VFPATAYLHFIQWEKWPCLAMGWVWFWWVAWEELWIRYGLNLFVLDGLRGDVD